MAGSQAAIAALLARMAFPEFNDIVFAESSERALPGLVECRARVRGNFLWFQPIYSDKPFALALGPRSVIREASPAVLAAAAARRPPPKPQAPAPRGVLPRGVGHFGVVVQPESSSPSGSRVVALPTLEAALSFRAAAEGVVRVLRGDGDSGAAATGPRGDSGPSDGPTEAFVPGRVVAAVADVAAASADVSGLEPGTLYLARVRARTAAGWGPWSDAVSARTLGRPSTGGPVCAAAEGEDCFDPFRVRVSWLGLAPPAADDAPTAAVEVAVLPLERWEDASSAEAAAGEAGEGPRDAVVLALAAQRAVMAVSPGDAGGSALVEGLPPGRSWVPVARLCNAAGVGPWGPPADAAAAGANSAAGAAADTAVGADDGADARLSGVPSAPEEDADGETVDPTTGVMVSVAGSDSQGGRPPTVATVGGLRPSTWYRVRVRARNAVGRGPWSVWSQPTTTLRRPTPVGPSCRIVARTATTITAEWSRAELAAEDAPLSGYGAACQCLDDHVTAALPGATDPEADWAAVGALAEGAPFQPSWSGRATVEGIVFEGLRPGSAYRVAVAARNSLGAGAPGPPSVPALTLRAPSRPPSHRSIAPEPLSSTSVSVRWRVPPRRRDDCGAESFRLEWQQLPAEPARRLDDWHRDVAAASPPADTPTAGAASGAGAAPAAADAEASSATALPEASLLEGALEGRVDGAVDVPAGGAADWESDPRAVDGGIDTSAAAAASSDDAASGPVSDDAASGPVSGEGEGEGEAVAEVACLRPGSWYRFRLAACCEAGSSGVSGC
ncbi:hypothetical protein FNF29_04936 [Cafeteria roenbergensis]|uniref:Fibronectin type-III domain-containing protein n=1 Tax=Cafeteria roenbergensis TaxID=33653 RepID=A0A5A8CCX4_CAFRO|nr:hypothetical protein FNF29_04936 [Cafeteria roenbergensis]|eukprot:KAA0150822.1 hypothetical protein FNF29_04936 [Cafeteria roenbergensis]